MHFNASSLRSEVGAGGGRVGTSRRAQGPPGGLRATGAGSTEQFDGLSITVNAFREVDLFGFKLM